MAFNDFLIERERARQNTVLIIDEAQNLSPETMEQVRLLSNFETATTKLLQILLVGQPELKAKLDLPELRQLKQRVSLRCQIPPLTVEAARLLHPEPAAHRGGARSGNLHGLGDRANDRVLGRHPAGHQHSRRPLPPLRVRRPDAQDRPFVGQRGDRVPRGRHADPAPDLVDRQGSSPAALAPTDGDAMSNVLQSARASRARQRGAGIAAGPAGNGRGRGRDGQRTASGHRPVSLSRRTSSLRSSHLRRVPGIRSSSPRGRWSKRRDRSPEARRCRSSNRRGPPSTNRGSRPRCSRTPMVTGGRSRGGAKERLREGCRHWRRDRASGCPHGAAPSPGGERPHHGGRDGRRRWRRVREPCGKNTASFRRETSVTSGTGPVARRGVRGAPVSIRRRRHPAPGRKSSVGGARHGRDRRPDGDQACRRAAGRG